LIEAIVQGDSVHHFWTQRPGEVEEMKGIPIRVARERKSNCTS
jgi:hypothetical protein